MIIFAYAHLTRYRGLAGQGVISTSKKSVSYDVMGMTLARVLVLRPIK